MMPAMKEIFDGMRVRQHADALVQAAKGYKVIGTAQKKELAALMEISVEALEDFYLELLEKNYKLPPMVVD